MISVRPLAAPFGAEVIDLDVRAGLDAADQDRLRRLLDDHQLLLFRGQDLDADAQKRAVGVFGPLCDERRDGSHYALNSNVERDPVFVQTRLPYHQDYSWTPFPLPVISLYALELSGAVAPTRFVSNVVGWRALPEHRRSALAGLEVVHARRDRAHVSASAADEIVRTRLDDAAEMADPRRFPRTVQPLVARHPRTGEPMLSVTELFTSHVLGVDENESERILQEAFRTLYAPESTYEHAWRERDLVVWDNLAVQHARVAVGDEVRRTLRRVTVSERSLDEICAAAGMAPR